METTEATASPNQHKFASLAEFQQQILVVFSEAQLLLQLFDPDFSHWKMNQAETIQILRRFLLSKRNARLQIAMLRPQHLELNCPRFMQLSQEFQHAIESRVAPKTLAMLPDSFGIADGCQIVRRYHSDHMRGEAHLHAAAQCAVPLERFSQIWEQSKPTLHVSKLGL